MAAPFTEELQIYRKLVLARLCEEKIREDYFKDEMKTPVHLGIGAEAIGVGVTHCLAKGTPVFGTYRNHNIFLALSNDTDSFFGELFGRVTGCARGKAGSMHMSSPSHGLILTSAVVATTIPIAVGAAFASQYQGTALPAVTFFGDGAIEEGVFWESLNFASLHGLKVLFICEDNDLAIHTLRKDRHGFESFSKAVEGFGARSYVGDGRSVSEVVRLTREALADLERKPGPAVLRLEYFRFLQHVGPLEDFDAGYRPQPEAMDERHDPVLIYEKELLGRGVKPADLELIRKEVSTQIQASVDRARKAPFPAPEELLQDVWVDSPREARAK